MKRILLSSAAVLALGTAGYIGRALAGPHDAPPAWDGGAPGPLMPAQPGFGHGPEWHHHAAAFGLFARSPDKALTPADVKIIATAILLQHGNHDWAVTNIAQRPDKTIGFSYATAHGDTIASFAVDPATGHIQRLG